MFLVFVLLSCFVSAIVLRSSDDVDRAVNTSATANHSGLFKIILADGLDECDEPFPVDIADTELHMVVDFINDVGVHEVDPTEWAMNRLRAMGFEQRSRLIAVAHFLDMPSLMTATASSIWRTWGYNVSLMQDIMPADMSRLFLAGIALLGYVADTDEKKAIVARIHKLLIHQGDASFINSAIWDRDRGQTLLQWAAYHGQVIVVDLLIRIPGVDVNACDMFQMTPLHCATIKGHAEVVASLLKAPGLDPNRRIVSLFKSQTTPLHVAVKDGRTDIVRLLLAAPGIDANPRGTLRKTPLHLAVQDDIGRDDIVELLVKAPGIDVNAHDMDENTALHIAANVGRAHLVELLLTVPGIDVNARDDARKTPLHCAAATGRLVIVKLLLDVQTIEVNARDCYLQTPLHSAATDAQADAVALLLQASSIDVNARDVAQRTPLHLAARYGHGAVVHLLVNAPGIDTNARDNIDETPLQLAKRHGHDHILHLLTDGPAIAISRSRRATV
ncbi:hypothetical protein PBRA_007211 [Plasmodiophora brassicae]|uniref:Uncharacterized protein n=1 Tax=Plasmodiophora brassicae TaxID=37360 RepID=A0A0G4IV70_PLABS|nr:hypothetical protein PBRA_007211 [Plasmodiophora brassicae]